MTVQQKEKAFFCQKRLAQQREARESETFVSQTKPKRKRNLFGSLV